MSLSRKLVPLLLSVALSSCNANSPIQSLPSAGSAVRTVVQSPADKFGGGKPTPIQHVVIIVQENRTPDYLFQGIPGADISQYAIDSRGERVRLRPVSLSSGYGLGHDHDSFVRDYHDGKMDGFDAGMARNRLRPFGYAPESEVKPYHDMARQYVLADHMFESNEGPSFPAHLYLISGTATDKGIFRYRVSDNTYSRETKHTAPGGCDTGPSIVVPTISLDEGTNGPRVSPCFDRPVLTDLLDGQGVSWRYYEHGKGPGLWHAFDAIRHVRYGADYKYVISPSQQILKDVPRGKLAGVTWVIPRDDWSDHSGKHATKEGPPWVAAVVNAIGESKFWKSTAIFVVWDDWGGWYDHVPPTIYNAYELGFRVPLLVISPYAKRGYVSKVQHEFGSILAFTEETYGIPKGALHATDERADDLSDAFDFSQQPRAFLRIQAPPFDPGGADIYDEDP